MAGPGGEALGVAGRDERLPGGPVDVAAGHTGCEGLAAGPLGVEDQLVELDLPGGGSGADHEGPADLAAVAPVAGAEADGEEVALLHPAVGGQVAGHAGVRAGADGGGEGGAFRAVVDQPALQLQGEVAFGPADQDGLQQFAQGLVGDLGCYPQRGDLVLVLDQAQVLDGSREVGERDALGDRAQCAVAGDGEVVLLDREGVGALLAGEFGGGHRGVAVRARQDDRAQVVRRLTLLGVVVRRRTQVDQGVLRARADQQRGALRGTAREVADVGGAGHQGSGDPGGRAPVAQPGPAGRMHVGHGPSVRLEPRRDAALYA